MPFIVRLLSLSLILIGVSPANAQAIPSALSDAEMHRVAHQSSPLPQSWSMLETLPPLHSVASTTVKPSERSSQVEPSISAEHSDALVEPPTLEPETTIGKTASFPTRLHDDDCVHGSKPDSLFSELTFLMAIDGSKQPQDFGVNANLGGQASFNWGLPLLPEYGLGLQIGSGLIATSNAVRVYELLGETSGRTQSFTTLGMFQRLDSGFVWGIVHDFLYEKSFDDFHLGQWRGRLSYDLSATNTVGISTMLRSFDDAGTFGAATPVTLQSIDQAHLFWRHFWQTGAQTTLWTGLAQGHSENNAVTGPAPGKEEQFVLGADVLMPLTQRLAIYGETNLMMPADTGTVDAFLGLQWYPSGGVTRARRGHFSPLMSVAAPTTFSVDLNQ